MSQSTENQLNDMKISFKVLAWKIKWLDDSTGKSISQSRQEREEIREKIVSVLKRNVITNTSILYLPLSDLEHRLRWGLDGYFGLAEEVYYQYQKQQLIIDISLVRRSKQNILEILEGYENLTIDPNNLTPKEWVVEIIEKYINSESNFRFCNHTVNDVYQIQCSKWVFNAIIYELLKNYNKYWTDGQLDFTIDNNSFILSLKNLKKVKKNVYSSNNWLIILKQYLEEIWWTLEYDYTGDECTTKIALLIKDIED